MKRLFILVMLLLLFGMTSYCEEAIPEVYLNRAELSGLENSMYMENGYVMVSVEDIAGELGLSFYRDESGSEIFDDVFVVKEGNNQIDSVFREVEFGTTIKNIDGELYVPLKEVARIANISYENVGNRIDLEQTAIPRGKFLMQVYDMTSPYDVLYTEVVDSIDQSNCNIINGEEYDRLAYRWTGDFQSEVDKEVYTVGKNPDGVLRVNESICNISYRNVRFNLNAGFNRLVYEATAKSNNEIAFKLNDSYEVVDLDELKEIIALNSLGEKEVHYASVYGEQFLKTDIEYTIESTENEVILLLSSYQKVDWIIKNPHNVKVAAIITGMTSFDEGSLLMANSVDFSSAPIYEFNDLESANVLMPEMIISDNFGTYYSDLEYNNVMKQVEEMGLQLPMYYYGRENSDAFEKTSVYLDNTFYDNYKRTVQADSELGEYHVDKRIEQVVEKKESSAQLMQKEDIVALKEELKESIREKNVFYGFGMEIDEKGENIIYKNEYEFDYLTINNTMDSIGDYDDNHKHCMYFIADVSASTESETKIYVTLDNLTDYHRVWVDGEVLEPNESKSDLSEFVNYEYTFAKGDHVIEVEYVKNKVLFGSKLTARVNNFFTYTDDFDLNEIMKPLLTSDAKVSYIHNTDLTSPGEVVLDLEGVEGDHVLVYEGSSTLDIINADTADILAVFVVGREFCAVRCMDLGVKLYRDDRYSLTEMDHADDESLYRAVIELANSMGIQGFDSYIYSNEKTVIGLDTSVEIVDKNDLSVKVHGQEVEPGTVLMKSNYRRAVSPYVPLVEFSKLLDLDAIDVDGEITIASESGLYTYTSDDYSIKNEEGDTLTYRVEILPNGVVYVPLCDLLKISNYSGLWDIDANSVEIELSEGFEGADKKRVLPNGKFRVFYQYYWKDKFVITKLVDEPSSYDVYADVNLYSVVIKGAIYSEETNDVEFTLSDHAKGITVNDESFERSCVIGLNKGWNQFVYEAEEYNQNSEIHDFIMEDAKKISTKDELIEFAKAHITSDTVIRQYALDESDWTRNVTINLDESERPVFLILSSDTIINYKIYNPHNVKIQGIAYGLEEDSDYYKNIPRSKIELENNTTESILYYGIPNMSLYLNNLSFMDSNEDTRYSGDRVFMEYDDDLSEASLIRSLLGRHIDELYILDKYGEAISEKWLLSDSEKESIDKWIELLNIYKFESVSKPENVFNDDIRMRDKSWKEHIELDDKLSVNSFSCYELNLNTKSIQKTGEMKSPGFIQYNEAYERGVKYVPEFAYYYVGNFDFEQDTTVGYFLSKESVYTRLYIDDRLIYEDTNESAKRRVRGQLDFAKGSHEIRIEMVPSSEISYADFDIGEIREYTELENLKNIITNKNDESTDVYFIECKRSINDSGEVTIDMSSIEDPAILVLKSHAMVHWKVDNPNDVPIRAIVVEDSLFGSSVESNAEQVLLYTNEYYYHKYLSEWNKKSTSDAAGEYVFGSREYSHALRQVEYLGISTINGLTTAKLADVLIPNEHSFVIE